MSIKYAVLGLLIERRGYGYDLANRLQERLGPGFRAVSGAVYVSLDQLAKDALATEAERIQIGRQVKVYYEATAAGHERFARWMEQRPSREPLRGELYLKLAVARGEHLLTLRAELERLERECLTELQDQTRSMRLASEAHGEAVPWDVAVRWMTDSAVLERLHGDLRWTRMALKTIKSASAQGAVSRTALHAAAAAGSG